MSDELKASNRREFFRIDGELYLRIDLIGASPLLASDNQILQLPTFSLDDDDFVGLSIDAFREHITLSDMDPQNKEKWLRLQQLLSLMKRSLEAELLGKKPKHFVRTNVNISGSGVAFVADTSYLVGQFLRLAMFFPRFPYSYVCTIGEVIKCEKRDKGYNIRCEFKDISEKNQDDVLRFVNQLQRDERMK